MKITEWCGAPVMWKCDKRPVETRTVCKIISSHDDIDRHIERCLSWYQFIWINIFYSPRHLCQFSGNA